MPFQLRPVPPYAYAHTYSGTFNLLFTYSLNISLKQKHLRNLFTRLHINIKYLRTYPANKATQRETGELIDQR